MNVTNNGTEPTVTVENEKRIITIGNHSTGASGGKPTIQY